MPQLPCLQYGKKNTRYPFSEYLLSIFYEPNSVLGMGDTSVNKTDKSSLYSWSFYSSKGKRRANR